MGTRSLKKFRRRVASTRGLLANATCKLLIEKLDPRIALAVDTITGVSYDLATKTETTLDYSDVVAVVLAANNGAIRNGSEGYIGSADTASISPPGSINGPEESIFGNDDRVLVSATRDWPNRITGFLRTRDANGDWNGCSGSMIGPFHFLTAGHCIHDGGSAGNWVNEAYVTLGRNGQERFFGSANATQLHAVSEWTENGDTEFDWGIMTLDRNIGDNVGWNGWWWWTDDNSLTNLDVSITGYPADLAASWTELATDRVDTQMYRSFGSLLTPTTRELRYNGTLDTADGMSGSAVVETRNGSPITVGIHKTGDGGDGTNEAVRMQEYISNLIFQYRDQDAPPTDQADLADWDQWFDSDLAFMNKTSVLAGDSFSVTAYPRNNGTATSGAFAVSFYASTNTEITPNDFPLGTVDINELAEFNWATAQLNINSFPVIPDGTYYVGWIIDSANSVSEFEESNNTGFVTGALLQVGNASDDHGNNAANSTPVDVPSTTAGNLEVSADVDWFSFDATAGLNFVIETSLAGLGDSTLTLYDVDGTSILATDDDGGAGLASKIEWQAPTSGKYYFVVDNFFDETGTYTVSISASGGDDHGNDADSATAIAVPSLTGGFIETETDTDWFQFNAAANTNYTFEARVASLSDTVLTLYDTDGTTPLATDDDSGTGLAALISWTAPAAGTYFLQVDNKTTEVGSYQLQSSITAPAVVGRHLFYDGSAFDGDALAHSANDDAAIDPSKQALLPTETGSFVNYSGYINGITGVMLDIVNLPATPVASDFIFRTGNTNDVENWTELTVLPTIGVRPGAGVGGSNRVSLIWPAGTIRNTWLEVTVRIDGPNSIVDSPDVHYWGNQAGEVGNSPASTTVNSLDFSSVSANFSGFTLLGPDSAFDINKDRRVNTIDTSSVSSLFSGFSTTLRLINPPESFDVFRLASKPDSDLTIYLDFDGHTTTGTFWNSAYSVPTIVSPPFSLDSNPNSFSQLERDRIYAAWLEVAEDFAPFDINVTTIEPPVNDLQNTGGSDVRWGARAVVTNDTFANCGCGGHAFLNTFASDVDIPTFVYNKGLNSLGETISHEVGHMLNLRHDGNSSRTYYPGHGTGETSWGAIMGAAFGENVTQWSIGDYLDANNFENDLAIMTSATNGLKYRVDDHGNSTSAASPFPAATDLQVFGIIERNTDQDYFSLTVEAGPLTINVDPTAYKPNLDVFAALYDAAGSLVASSILVSDLSAAISTTVAAGTYFLRVEGVGSHDVFDVDTDTVQAPATKPWQLNPPSGFSDYGSIGQYRITAQLPSSSQRESAIALGAFGAGADDAREQLMRAFDENLELGRHFLDPEPLPLLDEHAHGDHDDHVAELAHGQHEDMHELDSHEFMAPPIASVPVLSSASTPAVNSALQLGELRRQPAPRAAMPTLAVAVSPASRTAERLPANSLRPEPTWSNSRPIRIDAFFEELDAIGGGATDFLIDFLR